MSISIEEIAGAVLNWKRHMSMADPERFCSTDAYQNSLSELYPAGPPKLVIPDKERKEFHDTVKLKEQMVELLQGTLKETEFLQGTDLKKADVDKYLSDINPVIEPIPDRTIVLTFDDASRDHLETAAPILKKHGFNATFFVTEINDPVRHRYFEDKEKYMTWEEIKELSEMGFEIGNHTLHHTFPAGASFSEEGAAEEVDGINEKCQAFCIPKPVSFGYPKGFCFPEQIEFLHRKGFLWGRGNMGSGARKNNGGTYYLPELDSPLCMPSYGDPPIYTCEILDRRIAQAKNGKVVVFAYHRTDSMLEWPGEGCFERQMERLKELGCNCISMKDLGRYIDPLKAYKMSSLLGFSNLS